MPVNRTCIQTGHTISLMESICSQVSALLDSPECLHHSGIRGGLWKKLNALQITLYALIDAESVHTEVQLEEVCNLMNAMHIQDDLYPSNDLRISRHEEPLSNPSSSNFKIATEARAVTTPSPLSTSVLPPGPVLEFTSESSGPSFDPLELGENTLNISHSSRSRPRSISESGLGQKLCLSDLTPESSHLANVASESTPALELNYLSNWGTDDEDSSSENLGTTTSPGSRATSVDIEEITATSPTEPSPTRLAPVIDEDPSRQVPAWKSNAIRPRPNAEHPHNSSNARADKQPISRHNPLFMARFLPLTRSRRRPHPLAG